MRLDFEERKVLVTCTFVSACLCFLPGEWVSGVTLLLGTALLYRYHHRATAREAAAAKALAASSASGATAVEPSSAG